MFKDLLNLFFPKVCYACNRFLNDNEKHICIQCRHSLPVTNYHFDNNNAVKKGFYGRIEIEAGTALFHFHKKGLVQELLHNLKYRGHETIGKVLGVWLGNELNQIPIYKTVDVVVPVPLHNRKLRKRGYNQVNKFGQEIAIALNANFNDSVLLKTTQTNTQVFKDRLSRSFSNAEIFTVAEIESLIGKHILLVDDIITTGATIESCVNVLRQIKDIKISVATIAIA